MKLLLDRCLTNERIRDDKIVPVIQPTAFRSLVRNIADQAQKSAPKHDIFVELDALPENHSCDIFLIEILLNNLLDNAIKFSPGGGNIHLRGRLCEKNELILEIQDQGVGIPPEQIGLVFTQFFRTGQVASVQGSGLGLHLVQKIAQLHGGNVSCSSKLGVGSIFTVRLPVAE